MVTGIAGFVLGENIAFVVVVAADHESFVVAVVVEKFVVVICFVEVYISVVPEEVVAT